MRLPHGQTSNKFPSSALLLEQGSGGNRAGPTSHMPAMRNQPRVDTYICLPISSVASGVPVGSSHTTWAQTECHFPRRHIKKPKATKICGEKIQKATRKIHTYLEIKLTGG